MKSESGDRLTPKVNGILSFGTFSEILPSALVSLFLMILIRDAINFLPQKEGRRLGMHEI